MIFFCIFNNINIFFLLSLFSVHNIHVIIIEEIYNGLGLIQDTSLREDSIIYSGFSMPQELTKIDELLLRLLYSEEVKTGMDATECEEVIRQLYY